MNRRRSTYDEDDFDYDDYEDVRRGSPRKHPLHKEEHRDRKRQERNNDDRHHDFDDEYR